MPLFRAKSVLILSLLIFLTACAEDDAGNLNSNSAAKNSNSSTPVAVVPKDDVEELGKIIKLPFIPEEATYYEFNLTDKNSEPRVPAPIDKKLVAVLRFSETDANQIVANALKFKSPAPADIDPETWFPPELVAKSQETGDSSLKGVEYAASDFLQTPYAKGRLTRVNETNYFVLELFSF